MPDVMAAKRSAFAVRRSDLAILLLVLVAPAFGQDDVAIFNYMNNVVGAQPLFYYLDYVAVVPEAIAYALRPLPLVAQAVLYRVAPLCVVLILGRQLRAVLHHDRAPAEAAWLALAIMLMLRVVEENIWGNLLFVITPMFLIAVLLVLRVHRDDGRYSPWAMAGVVLAAVSVPFGALLVPVFVVLIVDGGDAVRRRQHAGLVIVVAAAYLFFNAHIVSNSLLTADPGAVAGLFLQGLRGAFRFNNAVVCGSSLVLVAAAADAWRRDRADRVMTGCLAMVGLGSVLGVLASDRVLSGGFGAAHLLPVLVCALVVVCREILRVSDQVKRVALAGVFVGVAGTALVPEFGLRLRGPLETSLMHYQFLVTAAAFRQSCRDGESMVFEEENTSPIVLCRPQVFSEGHHLQTDFHPAVGQRDPASPDEGRPAIIVGRPVFP